MFVQAGSVISANIYRAGSFSPTFHQREEETQRLTISSDDAPRYRRGNRQLLAIACMNIVMYILTKAYYVWRNKTRDTKWNSMTDEQRLEYLATTKDEGNKRLDFRFDH